MGAPGFESGAGRALGGQVRGEEQPDQGAVGTGHHDPGHPGMAHPVSEARKTATAATSSADGARPNGKRATTLVNKSR
jgi:hypothetical protein